MRSFTASKVSADLANNETCRLHKAISWIAAVFDSWKAWSSPDPETLFG